MIWGLMMGMGKGMGKFMWVILWIVVECSEPGMWEANAWKPSVFICRVGWGKTGNGEITIDSAAEESVCPEDWETKFGLTEVPENKRMKFRNASGGRMNHYGSRTAKFRPEGDKKKVMGMEFQVSDVKKPLAAVWRIAEKGNLVQFGPSDEDCFIQNIQSGEKVGLKRKGGSYVLGVEFLEKVVQDETFQRQGQ